MVNTPPPAPKYVSQRSKFPVGLVLGGGVALVVLVLGGIIALTQVSKPQDIRQQAYEGDQALNAIPQAPVTPEETVVDTSGPVKIVEKETKDTVISGKVCTDLAPLPGQMFFYNLDKKVVSFLPVNADGTFTKRLPSDSFVFFYQVEGSDKRLGYTNPDHTLKTVSLANNQSMNDVNVCDAAMDNKSVPQETYGLDLSGN